MMNNATRNTGDGRRPIDDPLPEHSPIVDEPGRETQVIDPSRPDTPPPVREPESPAPAPNRKSDA